jgi:hypothetical protein
MSELDPRKYKNGQPIDVTTDAAGNPTNTPQPKVVAATVGAGVGAAAGTVVNYLIETIANVDLPDTVEGAIAVLIAAGVAFVAGYVKRPTGIS